MLSTTALNETKKWSLDKIQSLFLLKSFITLPCRYIHCSLRSKPLAISPDRIIFAVKMTFQTARASSHLQMPSYYDEVAGT